MANVKISALAALGGAPATGDLILMVDISDVSMAPSGTDKSMTAANVLTFINASATIPAAQVSAGTFGAGAYTFPAAVTVIGSLLFSVAGAGLSIKSGANARIGESTLATGTIVVANTSVTANTKVRPVRRLLGGTGGFFSYTTTAGTGFTITSSSALDTSTVWWELVEMT